jgi:hypothetical protein
MLELGEEEGLEETELDGLELTELLGESLTEEDGELLGEEDTEELGEDEILELGLEPPPPEESCDRSITPYRASTVLPERCTQWVIVPVASVILVPSEPRL